MTVSRETVERFQPYCDLLRKWTARINLIAPSTAEDIYARHVEDCLLIVPLIPPSARSIVDLGSGAGLPGLIVAAALRDLGREPLVTLVESDKRKCVFLREAARALGVAPVIAEARILDLPPLKADVLLARALAPLTELLAFQRYHGHASALGIYMKGERHRQEIEAAIAQGWRIEVATHPGTADGAANLVVSIVA